MKLRKTAKKIIEKTSVPAVTGKGLRFTKVSSLKRARNLRNKQIKRLVTEFNETYAGEKFNEAEANALNDFWDTTHKTGVSEKTSRAVEAVINANIKRFERFYDFAEKKGAYKSVLRSIRHEILKWRTDKRINRTMGRVNELFFKMKK